MSRILLFLTLDFAGISWPASFLISFSVAIFLDMLFLGHMAFSKGNNVAPNHESYSKPGVGVQTLETIEEAETYNRYIAKKMLPFTGDRNIELGAGQGTISAIMAERVRIELFELAPHNLTVLKKRFEGSSAITGYGADIFGNQQFDSYDCVYSSNVLEHIEDDIAIVKHCLRLLKSGGFFVAIVPGTPLLYSDFDRMIGHFRRYGRKDRYRWTKALSASEGVDRISFRYINPVGALGWFIRMRIGKQTLVRKKDAMVMNRLIPFLSWLDYLPLPFGQSVLIVMRKA